MAGCGYGLRRTFGVLALSLACLLLGGAAGLTAPASAQSLTTGALSGVITDPTGASIPGAKVTATNEGTGSTHTVVSQVNGSSLIPLLQPGKYTITVAMAGFSATRQAGLASRCRPPAR
ncbi:MAG: carboxypeptidase-like regulatory domain-containing protein [Terriglobales bacterium]